MKMKTTAANLIQSIWSQVLQRSAQEALEQVPPNYTAKNDLLYEMHKCVFIDITNIFFNMTGFSCHFNQKDTLRILNECLCVILTYYFLLTAIESTTRNGKRASIDSSLMTIFKEPFATFAGRE